MSIILSMARTYCMYTEDKAFMDGGRMKYLCQESLLEQHLSADG